jgi:hypothetical protein
MAADEQLRSDAEAHPGKGRAGYAVKRSCPFFVVEAVAIAVTACVLAYMVFVFVAFG